MFDRRTFLSACVQMAMTGLLGRYLRANQESYLSGRIHAAISSAVKYLIERQFSDGAW